jgi:hypothetical protein
MVQTPLPPRLSYLRVRLLWSGQALRAWLKRWGLYALVLAAAFGGGVAGGAGAVGALAAWTVLPLCRAVAPGPWSAWALPALAAQALVGVALLRAMRPLLWLAPWRLAERALPLARARRWQADLLLLALASLPWWALQGLGAAVLFGHGPAWLRPARGAAAAALLLAQGLALAVAAWQLQRARRVPGLAGRARRAVPPGPARRSPALSVGWRLALLWWPLWRGPAQALGRWLGGGALVMSACLLLPGPGGQLASEALALWTVIALAWLARAQALSQLGLAPGLAAAAASLPLRRQTLDRGRRVLLLAPLWASGLGLAGVVAWQWSPGQGRPWVLAAWCLGVAGMSGALSRSGRPEPMAAAVRWLLGVVILLALAMEVLR